MVTVTTNPPEESANNNNSTDPYLVHRDPADVLQVRVIPSTDHILRGVVNNLQVLVEIKTEALPKKENEKRPPMDLAIVLDKSGSMGGPKLENSKKTIQRVIDNLEPQDSLHFIVYDSAVQVIFQDGDLRNKAKLCQMVAAIQEGSSTNMGDGLATAAEIFQKHKKSSFQRIFVFSDGLVNEGRYRTKQDIFGLVKKIHSMGISTAAFGIGADFDEDMMKGVAEYGHANYFFIENAEEIDKYVSAALGSMLGRIGTEATLKFRGKNGGIVKKCYGQDGTALVNGVTIGDIKQNNLKSILLEVEVTPKDDQNETQDVLSYLLSYTQMGTKKEVKIEGDLRLKKTNDEKLAGTQNKETEVALTMQQAADMDDKVLELLEQNRIEEALSVEKEQVKIWDSKRSSDVTGRAEHAYQRAIKSMNSIQEKGNAKSNIKQKKYHQMLKKHDSSDYLGLM